MKIKQLVIAVIVAHFATIQSTEQEEWITILAHGIVGLQANFSLHTLVRAKQDRIEGTPYEKNVLELREHPYLSMIQPIGRLGLHRACKKKNCLSAAYAFGVLFTHMERLCGIQRKNSFYTFGWSGLVSEKRRRAEARILYMQLKEKLHTLQKAGKSVKVRLIGFSHGATLLLNIADIRAQECCTDSFVIDEVYLLGMPVTRTTCKQAHSSIFKEIYNFYSRQDSVQKLDIFSTDDLFSHRVLKGRTPASLTQIEIKMSAPLRPNPAYRLPSFMRGVINQSPGHSELWFFGWTQGSYRKNLNMYPLPASLFTPYLVQASKKICSKNIRIDIRPCKEQALIQSQNSYDQLVVPFLSPTDYTSFITKALTFHPSNPCYKENFIRQKTSMSIALRDKGQNTDSF